MAGLVERIYQVVIGEVIVIDPGQLANLEDAVKRWLGFV
jgi:hypothetical protein